MAAALYEMLCQAYSYVNSPAYCRKTGEPNRMRRLRSMTLTYPSGMIAPELEQFRKQAHKAVRIFAQTLGKGQGTEPELKFSVDEASAVHLVYIWSEVQKLGRKPDLWFSVMGREAGEPVAEGPAVQGPAQGPSGGPGRGGACERRPTPGSGSGTRGDAGPMFRRRPPAAKAGAPTAASAKGATGPELRIACIDIGGGTSDLMIAKYTCKSDAGGSRVQGETLHRDGVSLAGDQLVKRLLELIVVPQFAQAVGMEPNHVRTLFGPEVPGVNREFRPQRINWINRLFVPLARTLPGERRGWSHRRRNFAHRR